MWPVRIEPDQPQYRLDTAYTFDAFGNRVSVAVSSPATGTAAIASRSSSVTYDANGQFPTQAATPSATPKPRPTTPASAPS